MRPENDRAAHAFYEKLNELPDAESFDVFVEGLSAKFYAKKFGRPSLLPGIYFRSLLIGYLEGIGAAGSQAQKRTSHKEWMSTVDKNAAIRLDAGLLVRFPREGS